MTTKQILNFERIGPVEQIATVETESEEPGGEPTITTVFGSDWRWHWFVQAEGGECLDNSTEANGFETLEEAVSDFNSKHAGEGWPPAELQNENHWQAVRTMGA